MRSRLRNLAFAEVRLDALRNPGEDLSPLFQGKRRIIATCREGRLEGRARVEVLRRAIDAGARCVDIELETPPRLRAALARHAERKGAELIVSSHLDHTPSPAKLRRLIDRCFAAGASIAKIACTVNAPGDNAALLGLLACGKPLVVVGLGKLGLPTRLLAPLLGAEFTFALPDGCRPNALGQLPYSKTLQAIEALRRTLGG